MKRRVTRALSAVTLSAFAVALAMSIGVYSFGISPYIHDYFNTSGTEVVSLDEETDAQYFKADYANTTELMEAKIEHIRKAVGEGTVLLKNENAALPIAAEKDGTKTKITLLGQASADLVYGMDAGAGQVANANSFCKHFDQALSEAGFDVNMTMYNFYANSGVNQNNPAGYYGLVGDLIIGEVHPDNISAEAKASMAEYNDVAIIVLRRNCGEGFDLWSGEADQPIYDTGSGQTGTSEAVYGVSSLELTESEKALIEMAENAGFGKVILMLNTNHQIGLAGVQNDEKIDAVIQVGGLGYNGIDGVVDVLTGAVNPSAKLIDLWSEHSLSSPSAQDMGSVAYANAEEVEAYFAANEAGYTVGSENPFRAIWYVSQKESIYVGYRYYETRYEDVVLGQGNAESEAGVFASTGLWNYGEEVAYTFGYGLSYTEFDQELVGEPTWNEEEKSYTFQVKVTNKGDVAGKDVVQIYASTPYTQADIENGCEKSAIQLAGFEKTKNLAPGESETLSITVSLYDIVSWDSKANNGEGGYILSEGKHYFALGNGAHDALNNVLAKKAQDGVSVNKEKMDAEGDAAKVWSFNQSSRDETTYSISRYTGETITNQLQDADINYWLSEGEKVTYVTRNDWNTFPTIVEGEGNGRTSSKLTATEAMLKEMIGQTSVNGKDYSAGSLDVEAAFGITNGAGTEYQVSMMMGADYNDEAWDMILDQMSADDMAKIVAAGNGFTYASTSISYPGSKDGDGPIGWYSAVLQYDGDKWYNGYTGYTNWKGETTEGAIASRCYEGTLVCAASFNRELEYERGELMGNESILLGRTGLWGISAANLGRNAFSGRNGEYYGEEPMIACIMGAAVSEGYASKGGVAFTKHFAFNDQETNRYGGSIFMTEQEARELSLRAFEGILAKEEGKTKSMGVMESFSRIGCTWVGESYPVMTQILRNEWGFEGCAITDMAVALLTYYHAPEAVKAGTDYFDTTDATLYGGFFEEAKLEEDPVLHAALRQAAHRILYTYVNSNAMNGTSKNVELVHVQAWWEKSIRFIVIAIGLAALIPTFLYVYFTVKEGKEKEL
ncbi:MAG: glycoside hydrolase family 3 C-terminal domain-containing protein [Lachnospiraceae bacterium]|nr:glycoside hydrolase family 3 C-terminal domain-containing protein [Lachnospiraceae bacterium]